MKIKGYSGELYNHI